MNVFLGFFKQYPRLMVILAIIFTFIIAYSQILFMYFWQDDFALLFKLQHPAGPAGSYGVGIIGEGAYKYLITMYVPFFPLFKLDAFWYYFVGFVLCALEAIIFYLFAKSLFQNTKAAIFASLIYAAGYIGSDTLFRVSNLWQTHIGIILALLSLFFFTSYIRRKKYFGFYLLGLIFFFLAVEFVYVRSHSLIAPIFSIDILILVSAFKLNQLPNLIARQIPFFLIFYSRYINGGGVGGGNIKSFLSQIVSGQISALASFFATVGNALIPNKIQDRYVSIFADNSQYFLLPTFLLFFWLISTYFKTSLRTKIIGMIVFLLAFILERYYEIANLYWYRSVAVYVSGAIGLYMSVFIVLFSLILWKKQKDIAIVLLFGFIMLISQIFGYYIQYPQAILGSTHRYLNYSFIGYSFIFGAIIYLFFEGIKFSHIFSLKTRQIIAVIPLLVIIIPNLILGFVYQKNIVENRSKPTENFYKQLLQFTPVIDKGALFYFDVNTEKNYSKRFQDFFSVGSMPNQTALAVFYNLDRYDLAMTMDFNELMFDLVTNKNSVDNLYSYYFGQSGTNNISKDASLIDTTSLIRNLLKNGSQAESLNSENNNNELLFTNIKTSPSVPMLLKLKLVVDPDIKQIKTNLKTDNSSSPETRKNYIRYLQNKKDYYQYVKVSSLSEWKYQESYNMIDNNINTSWRGNRIYWNKNRNEQVSLDLGSNQNISKVVWTNWNNTLTPTSYNIDTSLDNKNWKTVKEVIKGPERKNGEVVNDEFAPAEARFIRMNIKSTLSNDAPALKEIEVIRSEDGKVDIGGALEFIADPFENVSFPQEVNYLLSELPTLTNLDAEIKTDKDIIKKQVTIKSFSTDNEYEFVLDPGGTKVDYLKISINSLPANFKLLSGSIRNISLVEIQERKLIKYLVKN